VRTRRAGRGELGELEKWESGNVMRMRMSGAWVMHTREFVNGVLVQYCVESEGKRLIDLQNDERLGRDGNVILSLRTEAGFIFYERVSIRV
jgi:hypothetical protein